MAIPSFIFGQGTAYKTPEQLQEARRRVRDLMGAGPEQYSRPGGWLYALSDGLTGAIEQNRINQGEKYADEQRQKGSTLFGQLMNGFGGAGGAYPSTVAAGGSPTSGAATGTTPSNFKFGENADALRSGIVETAKAIGADPVDLATAISYETAGTFDPTKAGPRTQHGQHRGLIQFGEPQAQQYGVDWNNPLGSQLGANGAVASYFRDRGFKPGMSGLDLYSTINAGSPGRYAASDANNGGAPGSVADKWNNQMSGHRQKALALLGGGGSQAPGTPQAAIQAISPVADPDGLFAPGADVSQADLDFARMASGPEGYTPPAASAPQQRQAVAPYDFTGNDQLSAAPAMAFAGPGSNFNERWNAGAVSQPVMPEQAYAPGQVISGPDGNTYQNVEQVGGGYALSPVNLNNGPSENLLRQNDMAFGGALAPQGQLPQQAAAPMGYFPEAPSASRAPIQPQHSAPQPQSGGRFQALAELLSNPFVPEDQKRIAQMMLQQEMAARDPANMLDMEYKRAQLEALRAKPQTKYGFTTLPDGTVLRTNEATGELSPAYQSGAKPTSDMQEYNFAVGQGFKGSFADYQQMMKKAGASSTNVSVGDGEGKKFYEKLDEEGAKMFGTLLNDGTAARSTLMRVDRLDQLLQSVPTGAVANFQKLAGDWGVNTEGLDNIQAAQALINQIVPQQRPAGSGPMSDADLALFKQSVPRIINAPGGNKIIIDTMRGIAQYTAAQGDIAARVANREIKPEEGRRLLADLPNPLAAIGRKRISSPAEMDALPSGTEFIAPDGSVRRKP